MPRFSRFQLRTTDIPAARAFYAAVLGTADAEIVALPAAAAARGAPPHWLGQIGVDDVEGVARAFVARGAARLGPTTASDDGGAIALLRDPGGAVVSLATPPSTRSRVDVAWCELDTTDPAGAASLYGDLLGWTFREPRDLAPQGVHLLFAWEVGGESVGSIGDVAALPGVHPQWVFHFRVAALDPALDSVRERGGIVLRAMTLPGGDRIAICDDAQGAAFAVRERASGAGRSGGV